GFEVIALPFAACAELWRRLLYGTTRDGRVAPGSSQRPKPRRRSARKTGTARARRDRKQEARDRWLYQQCCALVPYKNIRPELKDWASCKGWRTLASIQGIRAAARTYAEGHDRPYPALRQQL